MSDPLVGHVTSRLRFDALLGRGGMGAVYRGVQLGLGRAVAIKVIAPHLIDNPKALERFRREARTLGLLVHPHVIICHDVGEEPGPGGETLHVMVLELVDGDSLGTLISRGCRIRDALDWVRQTALGLHAAHRLGIVHRDVKPDNILVGSDGRARLGDFGLARSRNRDEVHVTQVGAIVGSPAYLAPEACRGDEPGTHADCYALGVSLWQAATGELPFRAANALQLLHMHTTQPPPRLAFRRPALAALEPLVQACLAKHPAERPDAAAIAESLERILPRLETDLVAEPAAPAASGSTEVCELRPPASPVRRPEPVIRPAVNLIPGLVLIAAAVVGGGIWWAWPSTSADVVSAPVPAVLRSTGGPPASMPHLINDADFALQVARRLDILEREGLTDPERALARFDGLLVPTSLEPRRAEVERRLYDSLAERWDQRLDTAERSIDAGDRASAGAALAGQPPTRLSEPVQRHRGLRERLERLQPVIAATILRPPIDIAGITAADPPAMTPLGPYPVVHGLLGAVHILRLRLRPPSGLGSAQIAVIMHPGGSATRALTCRLRDAEGERRPELAPLPGGAWTRVVIDAGAAREVVIEAAGAEPLFAAAAAVAAGRAPAWVELAAPGGLRPLPSAALAWAVRRIRKVDNGFPRWDETRLVLPTDLDPSIRERVVMAVGRGLGGAPAVTMVDHAGSLLPDLNRMATERPGAVLIWLAGEADRKAITGERLSAIADLTIRGLLPVLVVAPQPHDPDLRRTWETLMNSSDRRTPGLPWIDLPAVARVVEEPLKAIDLGLASAIAELRRRVR